MATKKQALVVDDSPTDLGNASRLLMKNEYDVHKAKNGLEALDFLNNPNSPKIDLFVIDLMMPKMNGFDLIAAIKNDKEWAGTPVIVITGNSKQEYILRLIPFKINGFIVKPVTNEKLTYQLGQIIQNAKREELLFPKGSMIFDEGGMSNLLYHITSGYVGIYKKSVTNKVPLGIVSPYEFLGEMSLLTDSPHSAEAIALTPVRAHTYEKKEFEILLESSSMPVAALISDLIKRLDKTNQILKDNNIRDTTLEQKIEEIKNRSDF